MTRAVLYTAPGCKACQDALALLRRLGVEVELRDASRLAQELPGVASLPVIVVNGEIVVGFSPERIRAAVEEAEAR